MFHKLLSILQLAVSVTLIIVILLQQKGAGLGVAFGGSSHIYSTKRGLDKILYQLTIILSIIFFGIALFGLVF